MPRPSIWAREAVGVGNPPKVVCSHCAWPLAHLASCHLVALLCNFLVPLPDSLLCQESGCS